MKYHSGTYQSESKAAETLDNGQNFHYNIQAIGVWRSLVSRMVRVHEAAGSNPATPTKIVGTAFAVPTILICGGIRKGGQHEVLVKTMPGACFFSPWENPSGLRRIP